MQNTKLMLILKWGYIYRCTHYIYYYILFVYRVYRPGWHVFPIASKSPFKAGKGISVYDFISNLILNPEINYISIKNKIEVQK